DYLSRKLFDLLSNETKEKWFRLLEDYDKCFYIEPQEQLIKVINLRELTFQKYEKEIINPILDNALEKAKEEELRNAGLDNQLKELQVKKESNGGNEQTKSEIKDILKFILSDLSKVQKLRLEVITYLKKENPKLKCSPRSLHTLKPSLKQKGRDYLYTRVGNQINAKDVIEEVFRKPKKSKKRDYNEHDYR
ncbi:MAG: hypothetical protein QME52_04145, partial [Bacteroidota bacterium]|nr:hypothetical protein [Bacteroidota bacterium]